MLPREGCHAMNAPILVTLDGSELAEQALPHAAALSRLLGAPLLLVRVPEPVWVADVSAGLWISHPAEDAEHQAEARAYLEAVAARPELQGLSIRTELAAYPAIQGLLEAIATAHPRLVVITTHGRSGLQRVVLGSVAEKLIRAAHASVYVVRAAEAPQAPAFGRLLVALDGSPLPEAALRQAEALAANGAAQLLLAHVPMVPGYASAIPESAGLQPNLMLREMEEATAYLDGQAKRLTAAGIEAETRLEVIAEGTVAEGLLTAARDWRADAIFLTPHGRTGLGRWLFGSVSADLVRHADRPVWLVREGAEG